jgi:hypothetical protein
MANFRDRTRCALEQQGIAASPKELNRFVEQLAKSVRYRQGVLRASATRDKNSIFALINLARDGGDLDEAVWRCFLATHFGEYQVCDGEAIHSAVKLLCAFGNKPYWIWQRLHANPSVFRTWLVDHADDLKSLSFGNHRKFESKKSDNIWKVVASFLSMADMHGGPLGRWDAGTLGRWDAGTLGRWDAGTLGRWDAGTLGLISTDLPDENVHEAFDVLFHRLKELSHFSVLGSFDFVLLLNDMKLVTAEPVSCYLKGRKRSRGPLLGAISLWGNLPVGDLDNLTTDLAEALDISPAALESALCDWQK